MINIDYSVILQALSLLIFFFFLRKVLFRPLKTLLERREARIENAERAADTARRRSVQIEEDSARSMQEAAVKGSVREREIIDSTLQSANVITSRERDELDGQLKQHAAELDGQAQRLREELAAQAQSFGTELASMLAAAGGTALPGGSR